MAGISGKDEHRRLPLVGVEKWWQQEEKSKPSFEKKKYDTGAGGASRWSAVSGPGRGKKNHPTGGWGLLCLPLVGKEEYR
jgi:hypothetical protein